MRNTHLRPAGSLVYGSDQNRASEVSRGPVLTPTDVGRLAYATGHLADLSNPDSVD